MEKAQQQAGLAEAIRPRLQMTMDLLQDELDFHQATGETLEQVAVNECDQVRETHDWFGLQLRELVERFAKLLSDLDTMADPTGEVELCSVEVARILGGLHRFYTGLSIDIEHRMHEGAIPARTHNESQG